jgi:hypothetical protein
LKRKYYGNGVDQIKEKGNKEGDIVGGKFED